MNIDIFAGHLQNPKLHTAPQKKRTVCFFEAKKRKHMFVSLSQKNTIKVHVFIIENAH